MNTEQINAVGQYAANRIQHILEEKVDLENIINIFGKPIMEATKAEKPTQEEISSQKWTDKTSDKGAYQTTSKTDNNNSAAFQKLQKYLKDHNGFAILHGFKLWQFSNNPDILARRKQ